MDRVAVRAGQRGAGLFRLQLPGIHDDPPLSNGAQIGPTSQGSPVPLCTGGYRSEVAR